MRFVGKVKNVGMQQHDPNGKWTRTPVEVSWKEEFANAEPVEHSVLAVTFQSINMEELKKAINQQTDVSFFIYISVSRGVSKTTGKPYEMNDVVIRFTSPIKQ